MRTNKKYVIFTNTHGSQLSWVAEWGEDQDSVVWWHARRFGSKREAKACARRQGLSLDNIREVP